MLSVLPESGRTSFVLPALSRQTQWLGLAFCAVFLLTLIMRSNPTVPNLYASQADALLHGRLFLTENLKDVAVVNGAYYVPFAPLPTILLLPFVALLGVQHTDVVAIAFGLTILNVWTFWQILKKLDLDAERSVWLVLALFLGTGYWSLVAKSCEVWGFAQVVAVTFLLLAIHEALGRRRGILLGIFLGCAFLARQLSVYGAVFLLAGLLSAPEAPALRARLKKVLEFGLAFSICAAVYIWFNWIRFGNPFETGYKYIQLEGFLKDRVDHHGLFSLASLPFNFVHMFLQGPHFEFGSGLWPKNMDQFGTSIIFASPFVLLAFRARWSRPLVIGCAVSIGLSLCHMLLYYNNGWVQVNTQRFTLDFLPLLVLLVALGSKTITLPLLKAVVSYSIVMNAIALAVGPAIKVFVH